MLLGGFEQLFLPRINMNNTVSWISQFNLFSGLQCIEKMRVCYLVQALIHSHLDNCNSLFFGIPRIKATICTHIQDCSESVNHCKCQNFYQVIWDSNLDCQINPNMHACWISPKKLWIQYFVSISRFTKFRKNQDVTAGEMLINLLKSLFRNGEEKGKSGSESISGTGKS